jgi:hypothetical protein
MFSSGGEMKKEELGQHASYETRLFLKLYN